MSIGLVYVMRFERLCGQVLAGLVCHSLDRKSAVELSFNFPMPLSAAAFVGRKIVDLPRKALNTLSLPQRGISIVYALKIRTV
jgi:undecaprenyl pyrophosphate phosphatase UppP